jgi:hypothetical protein
MNKPHSKAGPDHLLKHQLLQHCLAESCDRAAGLPGKTLSESDWTEVVDLAALHGVLPLLYERLTTVACPPTVPERVLQRLRLGFLMNGAKNALLFKELAQVLRALEQANIPVIVLKGAHLAASVYSHMAVRTMGDIDLLVGRNDLEKSVSRLGDLGYSAKTKVTDIDTWCETHRHWPRMFRPPPAPGIEIHWALTAPSKFSNIATAGFWERSRPTTIAGVGARVLSPEDLLLHLCLHTASGGEGPFRSGLRPLCDIAAVVHCWQEEIAWQQIQSRAIEWQADRCVYMALWLAKELLAAGIPDSVLKSLRPPDLDEHRAALAVNQVVLGVAERLSFRSLLNALINRCSSEPSHGNLGVPLKALHPSRNYMAQATPGHHGVPLKWVRICSCYLTWAVLLLRRAAHAAWRWGLHPREMVAYLERVHENNLLWNWLVGANPERESILHLRMPPR